jgi:flagellar biosynthesis protein FlhG
MFWGNKFVISVASGKGGIGKSCFAANIGVMMAQMGKRVVLVDADIGAANLHTMVGVAYPEVTLNDFVNGQVLSLEQVMIPTPYDNLRLLSSASDVLSISSPNYKNRQKLVRALQKLEADVIIFDIAAGAHQRAMDFFSLAPFGIIVVGPIPTSLENAFSFLKNLLMRCLLRIFYHDAETRQAIMTMIDPRQKGHIPEFGDLLTELEKRAPEGVRKFRAEFSEEHYRLGIVTNVVKTSAQLAVTDKFAKMVRRYLGLNVLPLGALPYEAAMDASIIERIPHVIKFPAGAYTRNMKSIISAISSNSDLPKKI